MVIFGIDALLTQHPDWKNASIGFVTNEAATTNRLVPSRKALMDAGFRLTRLFAPEHGLNVKGADGDAMADGMDVLTGLPVISLYGSKLAPAKADLEGIDLLLFDIPDIGARFYTYLWTLSYLLETAAAYQIPLVILDRPNPVSGRMDLAEGPMLDMANASFIGRWPIPIRHAATYGELADHFNKTRGIGAALTVIPCKNWTRAQMQPQWQVPFVPTSPAIGSFISMLLYPGLCLLEATNISVGRGTDTSFTVAGAPWMQAGQVAAMMNDLSGGDTRATVCRFHPQHSLYADQACLGISIDVVDPDYFQPVQYGLLLLKLVKTLHPATFQWNTYPTAVNPTGKNHLDKLTGITNSEALFELAFPNFVAEITRLTRCREWANDIAGSLLYA